MSLRQIIKESLLLEAGGIAYSVIPYTEVLLTRIEKEIDIFFKKLTDKYLETVGYMRRDGYLPMPDHVVSFEIPYRTLARYIDYETFVDFPVAKLSVDLKIMYVDKESEHDDNYSVSGGAWPIFAGYVGTDSTKFFQKYNYKLSQRLKPGRFPMSKKKQESVQRVLAGDIDFDIVFYQGFDKESPQMVDFKRELKAVVLHEMMHLYEGYKNKAGDIRLVSKDPSTSKKPKTIHQTSKSYLSNAKMVGIPKKIVNHMEIILNNYYNTLPAEVKAITIEMYPYASEMEMSDFFETYQGRRVKGLKNFSAEKFYESLIEKTEEYFNQKGVEYDEGDMEAFFEQIRMRLQKKYRESAIANHEIIDEKFLKQKDLYSLIEYMAKQIRSGGEQLFRNVGRLYSLKQK